VDNQKTGGEKRCRKKNFFEPVFGVYFASLTAGNIPLKREEIFNNKAGIITQKSLVNN
jgi:hypothetical protein